MGYVIKHLTEEEQVAFKEVHFLAEPKEWVVVDEDQVLDLAYGFYNTEEEAQSDLSMLNLTGVVEADFDNWLKREVEETGLTHEQVSEIIKNYVAI